MLQGRYLILLYDGVSGMGTTSYQCVNCVIKTCMNAMLTCEFMNKQVLFLLQLSRSVAHYHKENHMQQVKSEKEELARLRKIASSIAKEVKHFWESIRKVGIGMCVVFLANWVHGAWYKG